MTDQTPEISAVQARFLHSFGFVVLMGCLTAFDPLSIDMYLPAFSQIQSDLKTTYSAVELSLSSFFIGMALGQIFYGPLADRYGRKKPLLIGMALYMVASLSCGFAQNIETLIGLRVLQAFGGCSGMVITRAIVRDVFDRKKSAQFFSSMTLIFGLAPILAPSIGGFINHLAGWRMIFFLLAGLNTLCLTAILCFLPETLYQRNTDLTIASAFKKYLRLFKDQNFIGYTIPDSFIRAGMFAYIAGSPFVFMELYHVPPQNYGWLFGSNALGLVTMSQVNKLLLRKFEPDRILRMTRYFALGAAILLITLPFFSSSLWAVALPLFLFVGSLGLIGPNSTAMALAQQGHQAGLASALYGTLQWSMAMLSSFAVSRLHNGTLYPMTIVIIFCALISVLGFQILVRKSRETV